MSIVFFRNAALFTASVAATYVVLAPVPSQAGHYVGATGNTSCTTLNRNDDASITMFYDDLQSETTDAANWNRTNNLDPTSINTSRLFTFQDSINLVLLDKYYVDYCGRPWLQPGGGGTIGHTRCVDLVTGTQRCETHDNRFNNNYTDGASTFEMRTLLCHESGHALGLSHHSNSASCVDPALTSNSFSGHDNTVINNNY